MVVKDSGVFLSSCAVSVSEWVDPDFDYVLQRNDSYLLGWLPATVSKSNETLRDMWKNSTVLISPIESMYGIVAYIWLISMVNLGKYASPMNPMGL